MQVLYVNCDGGGFADFITLPKSTTVQQLFEQRIEGKPSDYLIRVNRMPVSADHVMQDGDRVTFTPVKIEGAIS